MTAKNTNKFVIETASYKLSQLSLDLEKAKKNEDDTKVKEILGSMDDIFDFIESYIKDVKAYKNKLDEDIFEANEFMKKRMEPLFNDADYIKSDIKKTPDFKDKNAVNEIYDNLNQINLSAFKAAEKAKNIKSSLDIHIKDTESFIENKKNALTKMIQELDYKVGETESNSGSDFVSSLCDIEMASEQFEDFVNFVKDNDGEITDLEGETDDGQSLYINQSGKIRPPLDVIVNKELTLNITSGSVKTISDDGNVVWRDIVDCIDEYIEISDRNELTEESLEDTKENKEDDFLNTLMLSEDTLPNVKDEKFFSNLKIQGKLFSEMIDKIDDNNFSFYMFDAVMQGEDGEEKIQINKDNVLYPQVDYIKENANYIVVKKAAVKTNTGEMISLMEALILLD